MHCGHKKKDWYDEDLMVFPLDPNCEQFFKYSGFGEILPTEDRDRKLAAQTTIEQLGLNINKLQTLRKNAIDGVLLAVEGLTEEEILQFSRAYQEFDSNNEYRPFCTAIAYILDRYFST